jgi:3alpha(or 20beta)-hydroxysteroid dehydrogenase
VHLDVTSPADWEAAVAAAGEAGGAPVSVLAQTAGIVHREPIAAMPPERYERLLAVNLLGPFLGIRATIAPMTAVGGGAVVVVSSVDALAGAAGYAGYCASKAGVTGLVKAAAVELAPAGIRVNAIAPGLIDTPMIRRRDGDTGFLDALAEQVPLGRAGDAEDVARAALYLASDDAAYVTGTTLIIDGGVMAQVPLRPPA